MNFEKNTLLEQKKQNNINNIKINTKNIRILKRIKDLNPKKYSSNKILIIIITTLIIIFFISIFILPKKFISYKSIPFLLQDSSSPTRTNIINQILKLFH